MPAGVPMRIGVDAWNLLVDRRGIGRYTREVLREWTTTFRNDVEVTLLIPEWPAWWYAGAYRRSVFGSRVDVRHRAAGGGNDIAALWFPWNGLSWNAPKPKVAVLHDASLFALEMPEAARRQEVAPFRRAVREGAHLVTDSQFSKRELIRYLQVDPEEIEVVPLGVHAPAGAPADALPELPFEMPYLLFVGELESRKGIDVFLEALARLPETVRSTVALVIAGETRGAAPVVADVPIAMLGYVDDAMLSRLYHHAAVFVYPSRYEGFGLPVLEAMAHGTPVVASDAGGIPEAGADAALYFRNGDAQDLARVLNEVLTLPSIAQTLRSRGLQRARQMPWRSTAGATLDIIKRHFEHACLPAVGSS